MGTQSEDDVSDLQTLSGEFMTKIFTIYLAENGYILTDDEGYSWIANNLQELGDRLRTGPLATGQLGKSAPNKEPPFQVL